MFLKGIVLCTRWILQLWNGWAIVVLCIPLLIITRCHGGHTQSSAALLQQQRDECCSSGNPDSWCKGQSCYKIHWHPESWSAVRKKCRAMYSDWPDYVDIMKIDSEQEVDDIWKFISETNFTAEANQTGKPLSLWTSGTRCPERGANGSIITEKWTDNVTFQPWLTDQLQPPSDDYHRKPSCQFLVITQENNQTQYNFEEENATHMAVCEFMLSTMPQETTHIVTESKVSTQFYSTKFSSSISSSSTIIKSSTVPTASPRICKGREFKGIHWPDTAEGHTANETCPSGTVGFATWKCDSLTGEFDSSGPVLINCRHKWLYDIEMELQKEDGKKKDAIELFTDLADKTVDQPLGFGDISKVVSVVEQLGNLFRQQVSNESEASKRHLMKRNFTTSTVITYSNILRARTKDPWEDLPAINRRQEASRILRHVESSGKLLNCYDLFDAKENHTIWKENIGLQTFAFKETVFHGPHIFPDTAMAVGGEILLPTNLDLDLWPKLSPNCTSGVGILYDNIGSYLKPEDDEEEASKNVSKRKANMQVNTPVLGFLFGNSSNSIRLPNNLKVTVTLKHTHQMKNKFKRRCVFWNFSREDSGMWDSSGCVIVSTNRTHTVCECSHLTNFAVLMDVGGVIKVNDAIKSLSIITCSLSAIAIIVTLCCLLGIRAMRCRRSVITSNLCICLLIVDLLVLVGLDRTENEIVCGILTGILHYFLLASFFWMLMEGWQVYQMLVLVFSPTSHIRISWICCSAYGGPLIIVAVSAGLFPEGYGTQDYCWLSTEHGLIWSFMGPAAVIILTNIIIFIIALRSASSVRIKKEESTLRSARNWLKGSFSILCLLGLTWCFGFFYMTEKVIVFAYIFTVLNGLQGVFIFVFHVLLNEKARGHILQLVGKRHSNQRWNTTGRSLPVTTSCQQRTQMSNGGSLPEIYRSVPEHKPSQRCRNGAARVGRNYHT